ncbi:MAG: YcaO-like family protein, partial [Patulibacter sp.]
AVHRLGPIRWIADPVPVIADDPDLLLCLAEVAGAGSAVATATPDRLVQGIGTAEHATLVARAEAAERYAAGDTSRATLRLARRADLPGALDPGELFRRDPAGPVDSADAASDELPRHWTTAQAHDGSLRWVPAETIFLSLPHAADPSVVIPWSSSGMAAHSDLESARERALAELVERDAFVWTWLQRVSRERVTTGIPDAAASRRRTLARHGWTTTWVNLSLDSFPVILCGLTHERRGLVLGAACAPDPGSALVRATTEAFALALRYPDDGTPPPDPEEVRSPRDHLRLHLDPARRPEHGFLLAGADEVDLRDVATAEGEDLGERLAALGHAPLTVDLTGPSSAPFSVVRALAPGLLPLTFGWGNEPTGLPRAHEPVTDRAGRAIGQRLAYGVSAGRLPHPFP